LAGRFVPENRNDVEFMSTVESIWQEARDALQTVLNRETFNRWIATIVPLRHQGDQVVLGVSDDMFREWLTINYQEMITSALTDVVGDAVTVSFEAGHAPPPEALLKVAELPPKRAVAAAAAAASQARTAADQEWQRRYNRHFTFNSFVVGENNRFAHAACCAVADRPGVVYNPLFIHSPSGLGKTHLLQAIANRLHEERSPLRIEFLSSEEFSNKFIDALKGGQLSEFRAVFRNVDVLLIDDVQFFTGKERFQEEFFHTFNALYNGHKQIVLTSDRPPHEIGGLEKRLVSRFEWGLTADIMPPDLETRIAILRKKQDNHAVRLEDEVLNYIADSVKSNIRRLEGALIRLVSYTSLTGQIVTREVAEKLLAGVVDEEATTPVTIERIQRVVSEHYDIRVAEMTGKRRPKNIAVPRQIAMYLSRRLTSLSSPAIAERFNRNHATVLHAVTAVEKRMDDDAALRRDVSMLERRLKS
jgi:chromosomal replication initiator protein